MTTETLYSRKEALLIARDIVKHLEPSSLRLTVAGSLRRQRPHVHDIEIVYVPRCESLRVSLQQGDFISPPEPELVNLFDVALECSGLEKRENSLGRTAWGQKNKLAVHPQSGIPVDLFCAELESWWSILVCRTGGKESNIDLASAALKRGWHWKPYEGFVNAEGVLLRPQSEEEVFKLVGLPCKEPWLRD